jgi:hypothetical protein
LQNAGVAVKLLLMPFAVLQGLGCIAQNAGIALRDTKAKEAQ